MYITRVRHRVESGSHPITCNVRLSVPRDAGQLQCRGQSFPESAAGLLSGKYGRDIEAEKGSHRASFDFPPVDKERGYDCIDVMRGIADKRKVSVARIALAWLLHQKAVTSIIIIGAKKLEQLNDNIAATEVTLEAAALAALDKVAPCRPSTPAGCSICRGLSQEADHRVRALVRRR